MRAASILVIAALAAAGCANDVVSVRLPEDARAQAVLLAIVREGEPPSVRALDPETGAGLHGPLVASGDADEEVLLFAVLYDRTLEELGLTPGPLGATEGGRKLPEHLRTLSLRVDGDGASAWQDAELPPELAALLFGDAEPLPQGCAELLEDWTITFDVPGQPAWAFALGDDEALMAFDDRVDNSRSTLFRVFADGRSVEARVRDPRTPIVGAARDASGALWLGGRDRRLWRGRWQDGELAAEPLGGAQPEEGEPLRWISVIGTSSAAKVLTLDDGAGLDLWDSSGNRRPLARFPTTAGLNERGGVAWLGPEHALAAVSASSEIIRYRQGRISIERTPFSEGFSSVEHVPSLGFVLGTARSGLLLDRGRGWEVLALLDNALGVRSLLAFEGGFLWGGPNGWVGQVTSELRVCPRFTPARHAVSIIAPWGEAFLLATLRAGVRPPTVTRMILRR